MLAEQPWCPCTWPGSLPRGTTASPCRRRRVLGCASAPAGAASATPRVRPPPPRGAHLVCLPHPSVVSDVLPERAEPIHLHTGDRTAQQQGPWLLSSPPPGQAGSGSVGADGPTAQPRCWRRAHILLVGQVPGVVPVLVDHALGLLPEVLSREVAPPVQHVAVLVEVPAWAGGRGWLSPACRPPPTPRCPPGNPCI